jgi:hypothetical protein
MRNLNRRRNLFVYGPKAVPTFPASRQPQARRRIFSSISKVVDCAE